MIDRIGQRGITASFQKRIHELRVFLGFVLGINVKPSGWDFAWVPEVDTDVRSARNSRRRLWWNRSILPVVSGVDLSVAAIFPSSAVALRHEFVYVDGRFLGWHR